MADDVHQTKSKQGIARNTAPGVMQHCKITSGGHRGNHWLCHELARKERAVLLESRLPLNRGVGDMEWG